MKPRSPLFYLAPTLVALIYAAGPGLGAVHSDLARQTDNSQQKRQRQHQQDRPQKEKPDDPLRDASPNTIAAAPMKSADTETGSAHDIDAIDSPAQYVSPHRTFDVVGITFVTSSNHLHRPIYQAQAPPSSVA